MQAYALCGTDGCSSQAGIVRTLVRSPTHQYSLSTLARSGTPGDRLEPEGNRVWSRPQSCCGTHRLECGQAAQQSSLFPLGWAVPQGEVTQGTSQNWEPIGHRGTPGEQSRKTELSIRVGSSRA
ncbi:hypothetical protein HJG60_008876 [Phyllostomus discolor]|uniref:Uncharacterized protein n=1 Tax=Phyllostomus discolor TaxID=89673 RepID=A0A833YZ76_9CHIR|nr:hypothetical protein HJG60_008876 [Phyllostomus discolor]